MLGKISGEKQIRGLRYRYIIALGLVALLSIGTYGLTRLILQASENDAYVVNIAGRQRMLSQRITKEALLLRESDFKDSVRAEILEQELELFISAHQGLWQRDAALGLEGENSEVITALFAEISQPFENLISSARLILQAYHESAYDEAALESSIQTLLLAESEFLPNMNAIVYRYDQESGERVAQKLLIETLMLAFVLSVLTFEVIFIFQPAVRHLSDYFAELRQSEKDRLVMTREVARRNRDLKKALVRAEESTRLKSEFLATMSHEIRTPMNATVGMTTLLLDTDLNDHQREFAETIRNSSDALLVIINDILDFSKIESGNLVLESHVFNLREAVESALSLFRVQAGQKDLELAYFMDENVPEYIESDSGRLRQIVVNLLGNAVKFTQKGSVVLRLSLMTGEDAEFGKVQLKFEVSDTGIGIPKDKIGKLFVPFSQADGSTTRRYGGTGLGLSICRLLSELMGGSINVTSKEGEGSVFTFMIKALPAKSLVKYPVNELQTDMEGGRVLIVDDNEINRELLIQIMSRWGMEALVYDDPKEVMREVANGLSFDVAVLDYQMPDVDGVDLAHYLHDKMDPTPPLIALSSATIDEEEDRELFTRVFMKPLRPGLLLESFWGILAPKREKPKQEAPARPDQIDANMAKRIPLRVLIADDNTVNLRVSCLMLKRMGYDPDTVVDGKEAFAALERQMYDVILMDIHMPIMDGLEATEKIRKERPQNQSPWIVALTAAASNEDRRLCLSVGMDDYLTKPFKPQDISKSFEKYKKDRG